MSQCHDCGAQIRWATAAHTGRRIALDAEPSPLGAYELAINVGDQGVYLAARPLGAIGRMSKDGHRAHAQTCAGVRERVA